MSKLFGCGGCPLVTLSVFQALSSLALSQGPAFTLFGASFQVDTPAADWRRVSPDVLRPDHWCAQRGASGKGGRWRPAFQNGAAGKFGGFGPLHLSLFYGGRGGSRRQLVEGFGIPGQGPMRRRGGAGVEIGSIWDKAVTS